MDIMLDAVKNAIGASEVEKKPAPIRRRVLKKKDEDK